MNYEDAYSIRDLRVRALIDLVRTQIYENIKGKLRTTPATVIIETSVALSIVESVVTNHYPEVPKDVQTALDTLWEEVW